MVKIKEVTKEKLEYLIRVSYIGDEEGLYKYHVEPLNYEGSVQKTLTLINEMEYMMPMKYFEVLYNDVTAGYFTFFEACLYSFAIDKQHRTKKGMLYEWWNLVKKEIGDTFACVLYKNNVRALNFLRRLGMEEVTADLGNDQLITLINN